MPQAQKEPSSGRGVQRHLVCSAEEYVVVDVGKN